MKKLTLLATLILMTATHAKAQDSQTTIKVQALEDDTPIPTGAMPAVYKNKIYKRKSKTF